MNLVVFTTWDRQAEGLQHRSPIEDRTLFIFPLVEEGMLFHSQNVLEPFDIAFVAKDDTVLLLKTIKPPHETVLAPKGTYMAIESKAGYLRQLGYLPGRRAMLHQG